MLQVLNPQGESLLKLKIKFSKLMQKEPNTVISYIKE